MWPGVGHCAPLAGTSRLHRRAAYTRCLRCAGAPRRPASGSGLSLPFRPDMPSSLTPGSSSSHVSSCATPTRPSPRSERLGTPNTPAIRFTRGTSFEASLVRICYGLSGCSPPWTDLTEFPQPPGAFTSSLPTGWSPVPPLDMTTTATGLLCWRDFHPQEWQLASLHQTRTCRFPASGSSGESFAPGAVAMDDPGRWQRALLQECRQTRPGVGALTIPSRQPSLPDPHNLVGIPAHPSTVPRHAVVGVMAPHHGRQVSMLDGDRPMPVIPAPVRHPRQRSGIAALGRDLPDHVDPFARLAPDMGEAEEVERGAPRSRVVGALWPLEAEVDEARLVGMEREPIPGKTLAQNSQNPRGIGESLESHHEIVGVPDKAGSSLQTGSDHVFEPLIQHMVQVDVRKTRGGCRHRY